MDVELQDDVTAHHHGGPRNEPVASHLRDEASEPRTELNPLGIELNRRAWSVVATTRVVKRLVLHVLLQVAQGYRQRQAA